MTKDDDSLAAYDLSAWDVPPPAPGLADAVIARAREPAPVAALDSDERTAPSTRSMRRWWFAAAGAAVAVAAIVVGVWGIQRAPGDGHGEVNAATARALDIGLTTAALDPGALVRWRREQRRISVEQPRGTALWNVAAEDTLVIDAGAMVATVEASGASLRVEVKMNNASDARAVGISAATAVAVALVTIVVYEGTVRVRHEGQTVNVVPGAQYEVRPAPAPVPAPDPTPTAAAEPFEVGAAPVDPRVRELEDRIKQLEAERDALEPKPAAPAGCDEVTCVLNNYDGACCARFKRPKLSQQSGLADGLDRKMISKAMGAVKVKILECPTAGFTGTAKVKALVAGDGTVSAVVSSSSMTVPAPLASCIKDLVHSAKFPATVNGGAFGYPFVFEASARACDADALRRKGDDHMGAGMDHAALAAYEASIQCRPTVNLDRQAYMAACRSKNAAKARLYFAKLSPPSKTQLAQICLRMGIDLEPTAEAKDGVILVSSNQPAKILLDGVDTGKITPATLRATAGKHKITLELDGDKFTYPVTVKPGETVTLTKVLR
ncbi:MAG: PEGA domain-containing protein [Deltaproteobacteria bacterium]|nr:PEGA domain-containing protein [Deltaproteobacteria bacterium]